MTRKEYADFLLPNIIHDKKYYEEKYPKRDLPDGAMVVRVAPSPTGFVHFGTLFQGLFNHNFAKNSGGVFMLRIEDTDQKREVENGIKEIIEAFDFYDISYDEGPISQTEEKGNYGPYTQSKREDIYGAFVKYMIEEDLAYPSFVTEEQLDEIRKKQEANKERIGFYGKYASIDRSLSMDEVVEKVKNGERYVFRLKSKGNFENKKLFHDLIKGDVEMPENDLDTIILRDGLPTYHFAHVVDDYLMHTTHITRGDEWLSSLPQHVQMFEMLKLPMPNYSHTSPIQKEEDGKRRKISKRKDPEANVFEFKKRGIPIEAVKEYLMTVINSNFEEWSEKNDTSNLDDFVVTFDKMNVAGALFDMEKIINLSKNFIAKLTAKEFYDRTLTWALEYNDEFADLLKKYKDEVIATLNIEREVPKPRKDYSSYESVMNSIWYMFDELFAVEKADYEFDKITDEKEIASILKTYYNEYYDEKDNQDVWFNKMKDMCDQLGYASNMKEYKQNPDHFKGNVADISTVIRVALTSKKQTPNLYDILMILGKDRINSRFNKFYE